MKKLAALLLALAVLGGCEWPDRPDWVGDIPVPCKAIEKPKPHTRCWEPPGQKKKEEPRPPVLYPLCIDEPTDPNCDIPPGFVDGIPV